MTRKKKSRKPSAAPLTARKDDKKTTTLVSDKKPKKQTGKKPGNRQQEAAQKKTKHQGSQTKKDPRLGSKKPIDLGVAPKPESAKVKKPVKKAAPLAAIKVLDETPSLTAELEAIEQDATLLAIIEKQEQELALTEAEIDYFNDKMARHQEISQQLGIDEESEQAEGAESLDEEALWDKLDQSDFSDFE